MKNLPPIAKPDYVQAAATAAAGFALVGGGAIWLEWQLWPTFDNLPIHLKFASETVINVFFGKYENEAQAYINFLQKNPWVLLREGLALAFGLTAAIEFWIRYSKPIEPEIHKIGRKLDTKSVILQSKPTHKKEPGIWLGKVFFNIKKIRTHMFLMAASGGGKTQALWHIFSQLLGLNFKILVVDGAKGDWSTYLRKKYPVCSPWHAGLIWDIGRDCKTRNHAASLAARLIPEGRDGADIWVNASRAIFIACCCKLIAEKGTGWGWDNLYSEISKDIPKLYTIADEHYPPARRLLADAESKTTQSVILNLDSYISMIYELALAWGGASEDQKFSFLEWFFEPPGKTKKNPQVVILQAHGAFQTISKAYLSAILSLINDSTISPEVSDSKTRKSLIMIDELAQCGKLEIGGIVEVGRSKGVSLIAATQTPEQLISIYGKEKFTSLLSTLGTRILGKVDGENKQFFSKLLGEREVHSPTTSITNSGKGTNSNQSITTGWQNKSEPVVHESTLGRLGDTGRGNKVLIDGFEDIAIVELPYYVLKDEDAHENGIFNANPKFNSIKTTPTPIPNSLMAPAVAEPAKGEGGGSEENENGGVSHTPGTPETSSNSDKTIDFTGHEQSSLNVQNNEFFTSQNSNSEFSTSQNSNSFDYTKTPETEFSLAENQFSLVKNSQNLGGEVVDEAGQNMMENAISEVTGNVIGVSPEIINHALEILDQLDSAPVSQNENNSVVTVLLGGRERKKRGQKREQEVGE